MLLNSPIVPEDYGKNKPILTKREIAEASLRNEQEQKRLFKQRLKKIKNYEKFGITNTMSKKFKRYSK